MFFHLLIYLTNQILKFATFTSCFAQPNLALLVGTLVNQSEVRIFTAMKSESPLLFKLSYISIILFDTLVFLLAVARMGRMYLEEQFYRSHSSIVSILLRDGGCYKPRYACPKFHDANVSFKAPCCMRK